MMRQPHSLNHGWAAIFCALGGAIRAAAGAELPKPLAYEVITERSPFEKVVVVDAPAGRLAWRDLFMGLAKAHDFEDRELEETFPESSCNLNGRFAKWGLFCLNRLGAPHYSFKVESIRDAIGDQLVVRIDEEAIRTSRRRVKSRIRHWESAIRGGENQRSYGLRLDEEWRDAPADTPLVVLVHGYNSRSSEMVALATSIRSKGFPVATFDYPNDQAIQMSADLLAEQLSNVAEMQSRRRVALVTHSMGGLVARAVVEDTHTGVKNVSRLIMVSPPNQGSALAYFAMGLDLVEHVCRASAKERFDITAAIDDGLAEANADLCPDSIFLARLNHRKRNPHVRYSILLGNQALIQPDQWAEIMTRAKRITQSNRVLAFMSSRLIQRLDDLDEVVSGVGDGVVAIKRGLLEDVEDTIVMDMDHAAALRNHTEASTAALHEEIFARL